MCLWLILLVGSGLGLRARPQLEQGWKKTEKAVESIYPWTWCNWEKVWAVINKEHYRIRLRKSQHKITSVGEHKRIFQTKLRANALNLLQGIFSP